jgi:hypothetical protein
MGIVYYVSSHGLGHAVRTAAIVNEIPPEVPVILRTQVNPEVLAEEIHRPFRLEPAAFDTGCVQIDSFTVDGPATLAGYSAIHQQNQSRLKDEVAFLRQQNAKVIVSDSASFPLRAAREAGIPGLGVGNFTWGDIYQPLVEDAPTYQQMMNQMTAEYAQATIGIRLPLSMAMAEYPTTVDVPLVARQGTSLRPALAGWLDIDPDAKWCLVYLGQYASSFDWERLTRYPDWQFLLFSKDPPPARGIAAVDPRRFDVPDALASCQAVLGKPGYGTVADCMMNDIPMVFTRSTRFPEADSLAGYLQKWGRAVEIDRATCMQGDIRPYLEQVLTSKGTPLFETNGAAVVAKIIVDAANGQTLL